MQRPEILLIARLKQKKSGLAIPADVLRHINDLHDVDYTKKTRAASALRKNGEPAVLPLIEALEDKNVNVRTDAIYALGKIRDERAIPFLIEVLQNTSGNENEAQAAAALGEFRNNRAFSFLIEALKHKRALVRKSAVSALRNMPDTQAVPFLIETINDSDWEIQSEAVNLLGVIADARAVVPLGVVLERALEDEDQNSILLGNLCYSLGRMGNPRAALFLLKALNEGNQYCRADAGKALREMQEVELLPLKIVADGSLTIAERIDTFEALRSRRYITVKPIGVYCQNLMERADIDEGIKNEVRPILDEMEQRHNRSILLRSSRPDEAPDKEELGRAISSAETPAPSEEHLRSSEMPSEKVINKPSFIKRLLKRKS